MDLERILNTESARFFSRTELLRQGVRGQDLAAAVRAGRVLRVGRGLYASHMLAPLQRMRAVAHATGGVISHQSAAQVWNLPVPKARTIAVTVPRDRRKRTDRGVVTYWADLRPADIELGLGVPVTTPLRTLVDLARTIPPPEAVAAADASLRLGLVLPGDVARLESYVGRGSGRVRKMAELADGRAESPHESRVRVLLVLAGLPPEALQLVVADPAGDWRYRFDLAYPSAMTAVEADGLQYHGGPDRVRQDALRDRRVAGLGWLTVRIHDADVREHPEETVSPG